MEQFEGKTQDERSGILLTLEDVADILDVHVNTVRGWADIGKLPFLPVGPRGDLRFWMDDVIAFVMEQTKGEPGMEQPKYEMDAKGKRYKLELGYIVSTFDAHVDEARTLVEAELLPYVYKYTELCSNPRPESRVREEDSRFLLLK